MEMHSEWQLGKADPVTLEIEAESIKLRNWMVALGAKLSCPPFLNSTALNTKLPTRTLSFSLSYIL